MESPIQPAADLRAGPRRVVRKILKDDEVFARLEKENSAS